MCLCPTVLYHYPATQSALAKVVDAPYGAVAERFELFVGGQIKNIEIGTPPPTEQLGALLSGHLGVEITTFVTF